MAEVSLALMALTNKTSSIDSEGISSTATVLDNIISIGSPSPQVRVIRQGFLKRYNSQVRTRTSDRQLAIILKIIISTKPVGSIQILTALSAMVKTTTPEVIPGPLYFFPRRNGTVRGSPRES